MELRKHLRVRDRCAELRKSAPGGEQSQWRSVLGTAQEPLATVAGEAPASGVWQREQGGGHEPSPVGPCGPWSRLRILFQVCQGKPLESSEYGRDVSKALTNSEPGAGTPRHMLSQIVPKLALPSNKEQRSLRPSCPWI